jgi:hypothetical protein
MEKLVVMREHMNNWYSLEAYHISKLVAELPLQVCSLVEMAGLRQGELYNGVYALQTFVSYNPIAAAAIVTIIITLWL